MDAYLETAAAHQRGVFTAAQARAAGLTVAEIQGMCRTGRWMRLHRGVYAERALADALDARDRHLLDCAAIALALRRPFVLALGSAVRFHALRTLSPVPELVCGIDAGECRYGKGYHISGAHLRPSHVREADGWRVTSPARTVVDAARTSSFTAGVVIADSALQLGLTTKAELTQVALDCSHHEGIGRAARACGFAEVGAESVMESVSRIGLVARGLPPPQLQAEVYDGLGFIGRADMYWAALGVVGEVDGKVKYLEPYAERRAEEVLWAEKQRMERMENAGLPVVRWLPAELREHPDRVVARLYAASRRAVTMTRAYRIGSAQQSKRAS